MKFRVDLEALDKPNPMEHDPGGFGVRKTPKTCFEKFPAQPGVRVLE